MLNETYITARVAKHLSVVFPIKNVLKQGDALSPLLLNFGLEYVIRRVQVKQEDLKLNAAHQLLVYSEDVNVEGGSVHTIQKNTEGLLVATKDIGLAVNADKTKYMVMSRRQKARRSYNIKIDKKSFKTVEEFKYLGTTDQNSLQEEIKSRLKSGNAC